MTGWDKKPTKQEQLTIQCYGQNTAELKNLINEAIDFGQEKDSTLVNIYQVHRWGGEWEKCLQKRPRKMDSVILDSDIADRITSDINRFMVSG